MVVAYRVVRVLQYTIHRRGTYKRFSHTTLLCVPRVTTTTVIMYYNTRFASLGSGLSARTPFFFFSQFASSRSPDGRGEKKKIVVNTTYHYIVICARHRSRNASRFLHFVRAFYALLPLRRVVPPVACNRSGVARLDISCFMRYFIGSKK